MARATRSPTRTPHSDWGVSKTMRPGQRGAILLARQYGAKLVCVRYRESRDGDLRITTVELIVERAVVQRRLDALVSFKIHPHEHALLREAHRRGATLDPKTQLWRLPRQDVLRMGLRRRIAVSLEQMLREQVPR
jgi:hypothetical protein